MAYDFDLFTIGAGSGGVRATRLAALAGARVAVAEDDRIGGTCVIRGCVPKKLFVFAAEYGQAIEDAVGYGWTSEGTKFDWSRLRQRVAGDVARLSNIYEHSLKEAGACIFQERAEVVDSHTIRLTSGRTISAERILVAVGGRPLRPDIPGADHAIVSDDAFHLSALPKRVLILGGGYIACEFAHIFDGLGSETQLICRGEQILRGFDDDVRAHVAAEYTRTGIRIRQNINLSAIEKAGSGYRCRLTDGDVIETDLVMFATGRAPHTKGLGLEKAGVALRENGAIVTDSASRTNIASIYALGDVTDRINLTPVAIREAQAFADTHFYGRPSKFDPANVPSAVFGRPQVGVVGLTEAAARKAFAKIEIYKTVFRPMRHVLAENEQRVLMKLVVRCSDDVVVGVHLVGPDAAEMVQVAAITVKAGLTKAQWDDTCALHPTIAEELVTLRKRA